MASVFALKTLVETGTYYGEMVAAMKRRFDHIYSIEFVPELAERARKVRAEPHIKIFFGDSRKILPEVLAKFSAPALFWLDGGYFMWSGKKATSSASQRNWT